MKEEKRHKPSILMIYPMYYYKGGEYSSKFFTESFDYIPIAAALPHKYLCSVRLPKQLHNFTTCHGIIFKWYNGVRNSAFDFKKNICVCVGGLMGVF